MTNRSSVPLTTARMQRAISRRLSTMNVHIRAKSLTSVSIASPSQRNKSRVCSIISKQSTCANKDSSLLYKSIAISSSSLQWWTLLLYTYLFELCLFIFQLTRLTSCHLWQLAILSYAAFLLAFYSAGSTSGLSFSESTEQPPPRHPLFWKNVQRGNRDVCEQCSTIGEGTWILHGSGVNGSSGELHSLRSRFQPARILSSVVRNTHHSSTWDAKNSPTAASPLSVAEWENDWIAPSPSYVWRATW